MEEDDRDTEPIDENHLNLIGSDNESEVYLIEEEQAFFSLKQDETNYEDLEDPAIDFQNAIIEAHRQYDLRSRKNQDSSKKGSSDTIKTPDTFLKKEVDSNKIMVNKTDQNKDKAIQTSLGSDAPSTSTKFPEMDVSNKIPKQSQQTQNIEKFMAEKTEANLSKLQALFSFEG